MADLKPCPFCGRTPSLVTRNVEPQGDPWYGRKDETFVLCDCGCCLFDGDFHEGFWDAETRAVEAWNRRAGSVTVVCGSPAPKPPCTVCGTTYEKHGSYPTCASHPYTARSQEDQRG